MIILVRLTMDILWLDLLSWESFVYIRLFKKSIKEVYYLHESTLIKPFKNILLYFAGIKFIQITDLQLAKERIGAVSAIEKIIREVDLFAGLFSKDWIERNKELIRTQYFNYQKVQQHIKEATFYYFYFPVVLIVISEIVSEKNTCGFILKKTPFCNYLRKYCKGKTVSFYSLIFSQYFQIIKRDYYHNDRFCNVYYSDRIINIFREYLIWVREVVKTIFALILVKFGKVKLLDKVNAPTVNIGVVQSQYRLREDEFNDLLCLHGHNIPNGIIYHIETNSFDRASCKYLSRFNVKRITFNISLFVKNKQFLEASYLPVLVLVDLRILFFNLFPRVHFLKNFFLWDEEAWGHFQLFHLKWKTLYWQTIFNKLNIKIFLAVTEMCADKLAKAQALENLGGLFCGYHSGNYPIMGLDVQIAYDVLFTWGEHFINNNFFNSYPVLSSFVVGYHRDFTFIKQQTRSKELKSQFPNKFVLSYMDNIFGNDLLFCKDSFISLYEMLLDILEKNEPVVLICKPKREILFNEVAYKIPKMKKYIDQKRIVVLAGETKNIKEVPVMVGMASDLVVGLGISTAAAECYFVGTLAFHADLTGFINNEFGNKGLGKIVFRDIESLKAAIQEVIDRGAREKYLEYKELYHSLDPFQDGLSYKRVGFILKNLQELLDEGLSRKEAVQVVQERYKDFVHTTTRIKG